MQPTRANKFPIHREKIDDKTVTFCIERIDELLAKSQEAIPFDNPTGFKDWIFREVSAGNLLQVVVRIDGMEVGTLTYCITGEIFRELLITSCFLKCPEINLLPIIDTFSLILAKRNTCKFIRFHTIRKGLVKSSIEKYGYNISEIVLRKTV